MSDQSQPEVDRKMRPLGWIQCPNCTDNGEPEAVVMFEVNDRGVIRTLKCRNCGLEDKPGGFNYD